MADVTALFEALFEKSRFEVVTHSLTDGQLRVIGRLLHDDGGQHIQNWLIVARNLLLAQEKGAAWTVDISKQYFLKGPDDAKKIVYGHRLIIQAKDVRAHFGNIIDVIRGSRPTANVEVTSFPLTGASPDRNTGANGKGARSIGGR